MAVNRPVNSDIEVQTIFDRERNQTDQSIARELADRGVTNEDIVLGVQASYVRADTGYGVA